MARAEHWSTVAIREMRKLKVGDQIRIFYVKGYEGNIRYHVRGRVDAWLVVRFWVRHKAKWAYECLSPAWWDTYSKTKLFKLVRKRK